MRRIAIGLFVFCLMMINSATAVPASPYPFTLEQPDGYSFQARQYGDERLHWIETLDGYTIIKDENIGWTYAAKNNDGKLIPTNNRVGIVKPLSLDLEKHLTPELELVQTPEILSQKAQKSSPISSQAPAAPSTGTVKVIAIRVNFTDQQIDTVAHDLTYFTNLVNGSTNSLRHYYNEVSYGQLNIQADVAANIYDLPHNMTYYGNNISWEGENPYIIPDAMTLADNDVNFSNYDSVMIYHAGLGQESSFNPDDYWSCRWQWLSPFGTFDGKSFDSGIVVPENETASYGVLGVTAHEFGHEIGLPDLYDTSSDNGVAWGWELMDDGAWNDYANTPAHPSVWCKTLLGWLTPTVITLPSTQSVIQIETNSANSAYKISSTAMSADEYFLIENRQLTGYDASLPEAGILIWHIDESQGTISENDINNYAIKRVIPEDASNGAIAYLGGAAYSSNDGQTSFNQTTTPNSSQNNGAPTGIRIYNIGAEDSSMNVTFFNAAPTVNVIYPNGGETISGNMTVTWTHSDIDPADTHTFTIKLSSDGGTTYPTTIVSGLGESVSSYVYNTTAMPDGSNYKIQVIATDNYTLPLSGNDSSDGVFTIDNHPPVLIGNPTGYPADQTAAKNGSQITLNVTIIDEGVGVKNATVDASQINASLITPLILEKVNTYWINQSVIVNVADGIYYLPVTAYDNASNVNTSSVIQVTVDNTPPIVIANPTGYPDGFTAANNGSTITLNASINDALAGIRNATVNISQINSSLGDISLINGSGFWINNSVIVEALDGTYLLTITAYDNAGNMNDTVNLTVKVDNTPSVVTILNPTEGQVIQTPTPDLNITTSDTSDIWYRIGSGNNSTVVNATTSLNTTLSHLNDSRHYNLTVFARDLAGNLNSTMVNFTVFATPPVIHVPASGAIFYYPHNTTYVNGTTTIGTNVSVYVNGALVDESYPVSEGMFNFNISGVPLANGTNEINVTAIYNDTTTDYLSVNTTVTVSVGGIFDVPATDNFAIPVPGFPPGFDLPGIDFNVTGQLADKPINISAAVVIAAPPPVSSNITGPAVNLSVPGNKSYIFDRPISLTLGFDADLVVNFNKTVVAWYDDSSSVWVSVKSTVNTTANTTTANVTHFTVFAPLEDNTPPANIDLTDPECTTNSITLSWVNSSDTDHVEMWINGVHITSVTSVTYTDSGLSSDTSYDYSLRPVDIVGNKGNWSNVTISTASPTTSTSSSSGGGGGGGSSGEPYENIEFKDVARVYVNKDTQMSFTFDEPGNDIQYVKYRALTSTGYISTVIEMLKDTSTFAKEAPPGIICKNINIWVGRSGYATEKNIENPVVGFKVEKKWIQDNSIDVKSIKLNRYHGDTWTALPTAKTDEDSTHLYFESQTPGFSPFAITGQKKTLVASTSLAPPEESTEVPTPAITPEVETPPEPTPWWKYLLTGAVVLLIIAGAYLYMRKRQS